MHFKATHCSGHGRGPRRLRFSSAPSSNVVDPVFVAIWPPSGWGNGRQQRRLRLSSAPASSAELNNAVDPVFVVVRLPSGWGTAAGRGASVSLQPVPRVDFCVKTILPSYFSNSKRQFSCTEL